MPLLLSLSFPVVCVIRSLEVLSEWLYYYEMEDWLYLTCTPVMLLTFTLGCALNLLVVPIGLLVGPPTFFYVAIGDLLMHRREILENRRLAVEQQKQ